MYDESGAQVIGFRDGDMAEVFGTLNSKKRKQHHRIYLQSGDTNRVYPLVESVFSGDPLFDQYMCIATTKYKKQLLGSIYQDLIKSSLLYMGKPNQQHNTYVSMIQVQIFIIRNKIYKKIWGLKNSNYTDQTPVKTRVPYTRLLRMAERLDIILEQDLIKMYPRFIAALEIDKELKQ